MMMTTTIDTNTTQNKVFVPSTTITAASGPKDVPYLLGNFGQEDAIVFTKQSLIAFLKTHGVEVGPNCTEFSRLPRYATFGRLTDAAKTVSAALSKESEEVPAAIVDASAEAAPPAETLVAASGVRDAEGNAYRPTRRVREHIGGGSAQISALFGSQEEAVRSESVSKILSASDAALATAHQTASVVLNPANQQQRSNVGFTASAFASSAEVKDAEGNAFRPTRRVREPIGGGSQQIASLFGGDGDYDREDHAPRRG